ncbi:MAG: hypothetical protein HQK86_08555 [Nitrospinae bacterium]|nr:hypothetical protein [Nitrospinota bacterium]
MRSRSGSAILAVLTIVAVSVLGLAALALTQTGQSALMSERASSASHYAALSGLEWFRQAVQGYTTADRAVIENLNGVSMRVSGVADGPGFTLSVAYVDADANPATQDTVIVTSEGSANPQSPSAPRRAMKMSVSIPPPNTPYLSDHFDQVDTSTADMYYHAGTSATAHGSITPFTTVQNMSGGDVTGAITHSSEPGGLTSVLRIGGANETRLMINTDACLKWSVTGAPCVSSQCVSDASCQARQGMNIPVDTAGFQNYFLKVRARLTTSGGGLGIYFRAEYPNQSNPLTIDFGGLSGYIWQYDPAVGYIAPCDLSSAIFASDGMGMFFARRVFLGSETCGPECGIYAAINPLPLPDTYPFFCPENRTGLPQLDGWRWTNPDWINKWRTVYIYVYRNMARIYIGRQEITGAGSETDPLQVGTVALDSVGNVFMTGGMGLRTWGGSVAELDYIMIYPNDLNYTPATFGG